ncbi:U-box domain-containing protein 33-like isoform X2 [Lotus japonicus]|uniref:U-box domain-containing protein 33-like isoform X2 n=1 Tax=Lotus japonicus TaxID=34305 RepID=UPI0025855F69|nr:U-box domain-containing protein 33-like isoform X2 [Lotus japonicus]
MAVVSHVLATPQGIISGNSLGDFRLPRMLTTRREIIEEPNQSVVNDTIYVAVAKDVKDSRLNLIWAIQNSGGKKICILHVHVPSHMIPISDMGAKFPASALKEQEVEAYREVERQDMHKTLDAYLLICQRMGVRAEKLHIEMNCIEKGIVELISTYNIQKLVMGAASDKYHSRRMTDLRSKKAIYVKEQAPASCRIQFICKGYLIYTRDRSLSGGNVGVTSPLVQQMPNTEVGLLTHFRSHSVSFGKSVKDQVLFRRASSTNDGHGKSIASVFSPCSQSGSVMSPNLINDGSENVLELSLRGLSSIKEDLHHSSPPSVLDGGMNDTLYDQLEQAMSEAENARCDVYQEALRRGKAEKFAIDAIRRTKATEIMYKEELKQRKEAEEELDNAKAEIDNMISQRDKVNKELQLARDQKTSLRNQITSTELTMKDLEQKIMSAVDLLQNCKNERDDLQIQRDNALREAENFKKEQGEASSTHHVLPLFSEFSFSEIVEATGNFNPSMKIGEGGYGSIFRGILRHTEVAIKMLNPNSTQGPSEFQQEVEVLSKLRHPNLITLIGACPESWTLVYEYLPNGSLEDRLCCKDNTHALSWQTRINIATELCSALIFLHSSKPHSIVHADLKPSNILLDANLVSKLSDFGICRVLSCQEDSSNNSTEFWRTMPKGTFVYMDPEFLNSGELTEKSDVYSFGIILLRLITGRPALGIIKEVQCALHAGKLKSLLDPLSGDLPFEQAEKLACLALRCCDMNRNSRPNLHSDVWRTLELMRASCGGTHTFELSSQGHCQPPPYFICPILQEVMRDPHVAADGFTYEAEAIRGWLESGHDTSPRTSSKLTHYNLVSNHALRYAIQDWLQSH